MSQHQHYQQAKAAREGEKLTRMAKENGLFTKQDVHDLIATVMIEFLNGMIFRSKKVIEVGDGNGAHQVQDQLMEFIHTNHLDARKTIGDWVELIKKN